MHPKQSTWSFLTSSGLLLLGWALFSCTPKVVPLVFWPATAYVQCSPLCQSQGQSWIALHSGTTLRMHVESPAIHLLLQDTWEVDLSERSQYNIWQMQLDKGAPHLLSLRNNPRQHEIAQHLGSGRHSLSLVKRTEALMGASRMEGLMLPRGAQLLPHTAFSPMKLLLIGDSITAGYGNEGAHAQCHFTPETENADSSYGMIAGRMLQAEVGLLAWSGRGIVRNGDANDTLLLQHHLEQSLINALPDPSQGYVEPPIAIVINVGTNDFRAGIPEQQLFVGRYLELIQLIRRYFPQSHLILATGPMLSNEHPAGKKHLEHAIAYHDAIAQAGRAAQFGPLSRIDFPPQSIQSGVGCDYHPNITTHYRMAEQLIQHLGHQNLK